MSKNRIPFYGRKGMIQQFQRDIRGRKLDMVKRERERVADELGACIMRELKEAHGVDDDTAERVGKSAGTIAAMTEWNLEKLGMECTREWLANKFLYTEHEFELPADGAVRNGKEKRILDNRRDAARITAKIYAIAMLKELCYPSRHVGLVLDGAKERYRALKG